MPTIQTTFNWGRALETQNTELARQLDQAYTQTALAINARPSIYVTNGTTLPNVDPPANDAFNAGFSIGDTYVRVDTDTAWIMTSRTTANAVTWTQIT